MVTQPSAQIARMGADGSCSAGRRGLAGGIIAALVAFLSFVPVSSASAQTPVSDEAGLRAAFGDATETAIVLEADITIGDDCAVEDEVLRNSTSDLVLDGAGHTITQTCAARILSSQGSGGLTLRDVTLTGGDTSGSGGAVLAFGPVTVDGGADIVDNEADGSGGGIWSAMSVVVANATVRENSAGGDGGGIRSVDPNGTVVLVDGAITWNQAGGAGGGISAEGHVAITGDSIVNINSAGNGGGVAASGDVTVGDTSRFINNSTTAADGGGIDAGGDVTVTGMTEFRALVSAGRGGAIATDGSVWITGAELISNRADDSGGSVWAAGDVTVVGTSFTVTTSDHGDGGAIASGGTVSVEDSTFDRGHALDGEGGAIHAVGDVEVTDSHLIDHRAEVGGAVRAGGEVVVGSSRFEGNVATVSGGAVFAIGDVEVAASELEGNSAEAAGGGAIHGESDVRANGSTLHLNEAALGGAVWAPVGTVYTERSTLSSNSATGGNGGAINAANAWNGNSTFSRNTASGEGSAIRVGGQIGLALVHTTVARNAGSSQVAVQGGNLATSGSVVAEAVGGVDCLVPGVANSSYSYDTDGSCGFAAVTDTSGGPDPQLADLEDNGGPTLTMLPAETSPLVDAVPGCPGIDTDQRGVARPQGDGCDIGAVELELIPADDPGPIDPGPADPGPQDVGDTDDEAADEDDAILPATGHPLSLALLALALLTSGLLLVRPGRRDHDAI